MWKFIRGVAPVCLRHARRKVPAFEAGCGPHPVDVYGYQEC